MIIVDTEIKNALIKNGYNWSKIEIKGVWGYTYKYNVYLDGKFVEQYNAITKSFFE